jgi:hypothetical protein
MPAMSVHLKKDPGWYATFALLLIVAYITIYYFTGRDALGASARFLWNGLAIVANGLIRLIGSLLGVLARGFGWRRLSRWSAAIAGVGLGYAGSVVLSDHTVKNALGWRSKLHAAIIVAQGKWRNLPLSLKILVVAILIVSQLSLHSLLIIFPIAFLVPVVRKLWVRIGNLLVSKWYWKRYGDAHRAAVGVMRTLPIIRPLGEGVRLIRIRYLYAWRLFRYDPRYRDPVTNKRRVSLVEPVRLWWRGELDGYVGHPLLAGRRSASDGFRGMSLSFSLFPSSSNGDDREPWSADSL